ncbi:hypothetical protein [Levilactobacillus enshiensis]|uniref:hypothetical protein n=1 Tax=Levilactobacillus enshiensis TaxID=2590213 RepID=UPI00117A3C1F|nr:hypothetical protein [Levilactobacillus enshiensis]
MAPHTSIQPLDLMSPVAVKADTPTSAKTDLYQQVLMHPAASSERPQLTEQEQARLIQKLEADFALVSTDGLESC